MNKEKLSTIGAFLIVIIWGYSFVAVKIIVTEINPLYLNGLRLLIASVFLSIIFIKKTVKITKRDFLLSLPVGFFMFAGFTLQATSSIYIEASKVAFYTGSLIIFVPFILRIFYKQRLKYSSFVSAFIGFAGLSIITLSKGTLANIEPYDFIAIACALMFAFHLVLIGKTVQKMDSIVLSILQMFIAGLISLLLAFVFAKKPEISKISTYTIYSFLYLSILCTAIAFLLQNVVQKYLTPSKSSLILSLEGFLGAIFGVIFLKEVLTLKLLIGGLLLFLAILIYDFGTTIAKKLNFKTSGL